MDKKAVEGNSMIVDPPGGCWRGWGGSVRFGLRVWAGRGDAMPCRAGGFSSSLKVKSSSIGA